MSSFGGINYSHPGAITLILQGWTGGGMIDLDIAHFDNVSEVSVQVPDDPLLEIQISSNLLLSEGLGLFFVFSSSDTIKFDAPYVGEWSDTANNTVRVNSTPDTASFEHNLDQNLNPLELSRVQRLLLLVHLPGYYWTCGLTTMRYTAELIKEHWDFSLQAMNSLCLGDVDQAVSYLLDSL
ncbi:hypothetical protein N7520_001091 [Penicillium odoratum]|uniref:uncharacterized protein n=1 Tax=Penicillium odoratum TaxID=1167516 RepID=UPI002547D5D0|nr:uncharacterized protein N7520_001091 [Penicillium odoratum]KAJ5777845.1 hypothetical protein N7520_001091 [Penicillium odoratum]